MLTTSLNRVNAEFKPLESHILMAVASAKPGSENKEDTKTEVKRYKSCHSRDVYIF